MANELVVKNGVITSGSITILTNSSGAFVGNLTGTASWAQNSVNAGDSGSWASQSLVAFSASWASSSVASFSASWASSSVAARSASWATSSYTASFLTSGVSASWANSSSWAGNSVTASFASNASATALDILQVQVFL